MIHFTRTLVRTWIEKLLHIHDSPQRTAAAYALGVFWGFSPFFGMHTVLALACAFFFNLNRVAVVAGVYTNLPWTIVPYYTLVTMAGAAVTGARLPPDFADRFQRLNDVSLFSHAYWTGMLDLLWPLVWAYHLGSLVGAALLALLAYLLSLPAITARRRHLLLHPPVVERPEAG